ncbi:G2/mitotic-specific cyclin-B [Zootermopsis nevadensis]|uniref:G2/mitotic-specific cyclin-B n=1 Tax=Zootermopsis nevadensis TaxID=136037 RepID=A0A067R0Y6_ZOONE|nr:G2/mitotic-specific cyclin-B [Zootermopsis nevadensis]KDR12455.1 G2/mitotic-specific cyclin-B [Zootermopsis nevadensis]
MAQRVRSNIHSFRNQENVRIGVKGVVMGAPPAATKRSVLGEIGNDFTACGVAAARKVGGEDVKLHGVPRKQKEEPLPVSKLIRNKSLLKKSFSTSSIPKEVANSNLIGVEDIDKDDKGDPVLVPEYVNDIYAYLREVEVKYPIKRNYLEGQEITSKMRGVLIDWLVEVHQQFHLLTETLYLTVTIIDRYLQEVHTTTRKKLQLVGVAAMFLASKYEEMFAPEVGDFVYICDNAYGKDELLRMEKTIVRTLDFSFSRPLPLHFLRRYSKAARALPVNHAMAKYFLELSLVDYDMCHYDPSLISAAALYLSLWLFSNEKKGVWTKTLVHYTKYSFRDIEDLVRKLANLVVKADTSKNQAVNKKYAQSKFFKISCKPELKSPALKRLAASS